MVGCCKSTRESGRGKDLISMGTFSKQRLEKQKGQQWVGDKPLPEIGQIEVHKAHLLSQWATSKVKQHCKIEKQSANQHKMLTAGSWLRDLWLCPTERDWGKEIIPNKLTQWKHNSKAGWLVGYRTDLWNLKSHTSLKEELTKQLPLKDRKKMKSLPQPPGEITELLLKCQHQDWMLRD
jgi:hypothetical protein